MTLVINNENVFLCDFETKRIDKIPEYTKTYKEYFEALIQ